MKAATDYEVSNLGNFRISIHAAREGGDCMVLIFASNWVISIHAAREGGDGKHMGAAMP